MDVNSWLVKFGLVGETTQYDKKILLDFRKLKSWLKSVSAFANSLGGKLIFGVDDDDTLVGIGNTKEVSEKISESIKDKMDPVPQIDWQIKVVEGKTLIIVQVMQGGRNALLLCWRWYACSFYMHRQSKC
jgi:predicted HTH transcriptional regulator